MCAGVSNWGWRRLEVVGTQDSGLYASDWEFVLTEPAVTVVIPCHNAANTLPQQLESLSRQVDGSPSFEVVVADNMSTDGLSQAIDASNMRDCLDIHVVPADQAVGASYARNVGARHARADKLLFCDADDVVGSRFVLYGSQTLERVPLFSASAIPVPENRFPGSIDDVWSYLDEPDQWQPPSTDEVHDAIPVFMGGAFGIRTCDYYNLGGFDQSLPSSAEDNDFGLRAVLSGYSIARSQSVQIAYRTTVDHLHRVTKIRRESTARALLAVRYDIDPSDVFPRWKTEPLRVALAAAKSKLLKSGPSVDRAIGERWAASTCFIVGLMKFRSPSKLPPPQVGMGLIGED